MRNKILYLILFFNLLIVPTAYCQIEITLNKSFIESYKDRITMNLDFNIDYANDDKIRSIPVSNYVGKDYYKPDPLSYEDILIIYGRSEQVCLSIIGEMPNAKYNYDVLDFVSNNKGFGKKISLTGVWRIWCEYAGNIELVQGKDVPINVNNNTDYVFEINPVLSIKDFDLSHSLDKIGEFKYKDAESSFDKYSSLKCRIMPNDSTITIITEKGGYDLTGFILQINNKPDLKEDGRFIECIVLDFDGKLLVKNLRTLFIKDSEPEKIVKKLKIGDAMKVLGIPRINFNEIVSRIHSSETNENVLDYNFPYEMIIVSILE